MNRPPKPALVMLLWQVCSYVALPVPLLAFMAWAYRGEDAQYWLGFAALCVWGTGVFLLLHRTLARGFRDEDGTAARATGPAGVLESLKLPLEFKGLALGAFIMCMVAFAFVFQTVEYWGFLRALAVTTAVWIVGTGVCWAIWARGGLRLRSADAGAVRRPGAYGEIELSRGTGDGEAERTLRWRVAKGRSVLLEVLRDIVDGDFLPPLATGEQRWEVAVDGEPVALLTQSWTGSRWWPEPEWLIDPHTPFAGERVVFTRRDPKTP